MGITISTSGQNTTTAISTRICPIVEGKFSKNSFIGNLLSEKCFLMLLIVKADAPWVHHLSQLVTAVETKREDTEGNYANNPTVSEKGQIINHFQTLIAGHPGTW